MSDDRQLGDDDVRALLARVADDASQLASDRAGLRARMLEEFDLVAADGAATAIPLDLDPPPTGVGDHESHELLELSTAPSSAGRHRLGWLAAAGLVVLVLGVGLTISRLGDRGGGGVDATGTPVRTDDDVRIADGPLPIAVPEGVAGTDVIAGGVELDLPAGLELLVEEEGTVAFGRAGDTLVPRADVRIVEVADEVAPLADLVDAEVDAGRISIDEIRALGPNGLVPAYEVFLTSEGASEECDALGPCGAIGPVSLINGGVAVFVEIELDGVRLWWVERAVQRADPIEQLLRPSLATVRLLKPGE